MPKQKNKTKNRKKALENLHRQNEQRRSDLRSQSSITTNEQPEEKYRSFGTQTDSYHSAERSRKRRRVEVVDFDQVQLEDSDETDAEEPVDRFQDNISDNSFDEESGGRLLLLVSTVFLNNLLLAVACKNCGDGRLFWIFNQPSGFAITGDVTCRTCKWSVEMDLVPNSDVNHQVVAAQKLSGIKNTEFNRFMTLAGFGCQNQWGAQLVSWRCVIDKKREQINQIIIDEADREENFQLERVVSAGKKVSASYDMTYLTRGHHSLVGHGAIIINKKVVKSSTQKRVQFDDQPLEGYGNIARCNANQMESLTFERNTKEIIPRVGHLIEKLCFDQDASMSNFARDSVWTREDFLKDRCPESEIGKPVLPMAKEQGFLVSDRAHVLKNLTRNIQNLVAKAGLAGNGKDKMPGGETLKMAQKLKTAVKQSMEAAAELDDYKSKYEAAIQPIVNARSHFYGDHKNCKGDCKKENLFAERSPVLTEKYDKLSELVFDNFLLSTKFIEKSVLFVGSTSENESYHAIAVNRGFVRKNKSPKIHNNSMDAAYKVASLIQNVGFVETASRVIGANFHPLSKHKLECDEKRLKKSKLDLQKKIIYTIRKQSQMKKYSYSKTQQQSGFYSGAPKV